MTWNRVIADIERFKFPKQPHYTVHDCFTDYSRERLIAKGKDCQRPWIGFNRFMEIVEPWSDVQKINEDQIERHIEKRLQEKVTPLTIRRELSFVKAAINYAHRRHRIGLAPYIELPDGVCKYRRPLTEEEFKLVIRQPMSERLRRFYWVAYFTGHRAGAIEELTWARTSLERRVIDFNVPGRRITNKRRADDFPISDDFLRRLEAWKARAADEFVIGAGPDTFREAQYVVRELAGLTDPSIVPRHCMRKKFASDLIAAGTSIEVVGHLTADDPNTLRKHYVTHPPALLMGAVEKLGRA
ncbi:MAG TPA: hypothetical protein VMU47_11065 [Caldimonas sp.]|nr:hypothetical protein [Caldimonas sp.]